MKLLRLSVLLIFIFLLSNKAHASDTYAWPLFPPAEPQTKEVPIIMYHLITKNPKYQGQFGISPDEMESDLKYLKEHGYETIFMSDLIKFVNKKISLPQKPVILTFDDGRYSDYDYLFPLLEQYDMKAVVSAVGQFTDENSEATHGKKPHITWDQLREMYKSRKVEIQNHSYNLHDGIGSGKKRGESTEAYQKRLREDLDKLQVKMRENVGCTPSTFTYPFGVISKDSEIVLKELGIQASLSCYEGMNTITQGDPDCLFQLRRNIRISGQPVSKILNKIENKQ